MILQFSRIVCLVRDATLPTYRRGTVYKLCHVKIPPPLSRENDRHFLSHES